MTLDLGSINWLAVVAAALATFFLGALWYTALFGKLWQRLHGYSEEKMAEMRKARPPALFFGGMLAAYLVLAAVLAILVTSFGLDCWCDGALLGFLLWLGPALCIVFTAWLASEKPLAVYAIDLGYQLLFLVMMGTILAAWR